MLTKLIVCEKVDGLGIAATNHNNSTHNSSGRTFSSPRSTELVKSKVVLNVPEYFGRILRGKVRLGCMSKTGVVALIILLLILVSITIKYRTTHKSNVEKLSQRDAYNKTIGYAFDDNAKQVYNQALTLEQEYMQGVTPENRNEAANNALMLARIRQYHIAPNETDPRRRREILRQAAQDYTHAIQRIRDDPNAAIPGLADQNLNPEQILDQAQDYFHAMQLQEMEWQVEAIRDDVRQIRAQDPNYLVMGMAIANNAQNVHDSAVVNHTRSIAGALPAVNHTNISEIRAAIDSYRFDRPEDYANAVKTFEVMSKGNAVETLNTDERRVLEQTYQRIKAPENANNRDALTNSFMAALANSVEEGHMVCTMGRCSRVLNSLARVDANPVFSAPAVTMDMMRAESLTKASHILQRELQTAPETVRNDYNNDRRTDAVMELEQNVRDKITTDIRQAYVGQDTNLIERVIADAHAGI